MERVVRWLATSLALAICGLGAFGIWQDPRLAFFVALPVFYFVFALGYLPSRESSAASGRWLKVLLVLALAHLPALGWGFFPWEPWQELALVRAATAAALAAALILGFRALSGSAASSQQPAWFGSLRPAASVSLVIGIALVISSLLLPTGYSYRQPAPGPLGNYQDPSAEGWELLAGRGGWVSEGLGLTSDFALLREPKGIGLAGLFHTVGLTLYALAILTALAGLLWLLRSRFLLRRQRSFGFLSFLAALTMFAGLGVASDLYWAWLGAVGGINEFPWSAWLGFACWAGTLVFAVLTLTGVTGGWIRSGYVRTLLLFQLPLALVNLVIIPYYMVRGDPPLTGLIALLVGLQMQSWGYAALFFGQEMTQDSKQTFVVVEGEPAPARGRSTSPG